MTISFDRNICCDLNETISREWLVTNGLGGYAAGTVAGVLTRIQHGLLVAMSPHAVIPQLLLAKIDEEVFFDQRTYYLGTNEYRDGTLSPAGFVHLEAFRLEEGFPIFTYRLGGIEGILLEKRIWMAQGANTTYIQYRALCTTSTEKSGYRRSGITGALSAFECHPASQSLLQQTQRSLTLKILPLVTNRPYNILQHENGDFHYRVQVHSTQECQLADTQIATVHFPQGVTGCTIWAGDHVQPYHLLAVGHPESQVTFLPIGVWYRNFLRRQDTMVDHPATDDLYLPSVICATLRPDDDATLTIIVSSEEISSLPTHHERLSRSYDECIEQSARDREGSCKIASMLPLTTSSNPDKGVQEYLSLLLQASKPFLSLQRSSHTPQQNHLDSYRQFFDPPQYHSVLLANYYSMESTTREMLIALPGLLLVTGKYGEALSTLKGLARYFTSGILPDRLPTQGQPLTDHDYSSVDTTLWYFYALDYYLRTTRHYDFLEEVFDHLKACIHSYVQGTSSGILVDKADGLLSAQQPGKAMTWMNAYQDATPVTPRAGKAVEVNALWYQALSLMCEWSQYLNNKGSSEHDESYYQQLLIHCKHSFQKRFWYAAGGYLYDVVDGPAGDDMAIRPNQLFALSLSHPVLDMAYRQPVIDITTQHLLTPYGLRTLSSHERQYHGHIAWRQQEQVLHQGCVWPWLIGPYLDAILRMWPQPMERHTTYLLREHLWRKGLQLLERFRERFQAKLLGTCEGVLDGDDPYEPLPRHHSLASAISIGELLRCYKMLAELGAPQLAADTFNTMRNS